MKIVILITGISISFFCSAQKDSIYRPSTLQEMFAQMDNVLSPGAIKKLKQLSDDSIRKTNAYTTNLTKEYDYYNNSNVVTDLEARNLNYDDRYELLAVLYHRYLNKLDLNLDREYKYYDSIHLLRKQEYEISLKRDGVDGKYILPGEDGRLNPSNGRKLSK
jgi:hypothetical protein